MNREIVTEAIQAVVAVALLGVTVAGLYRLFMGDLPWTFFIGELLGLGLGAGLLVVAGPRRRRR
jgi:hypothetical protein